MILSILLPRISSPVTSLPASDKLINSFSTAPCTYQHNLPCNAWCGGIGFIYGRPSGPDCSALDTAMRPQEDPPHQDQNGQQERQRVAKDIPEKGGTLYCGVFGNGFHHEVRAVADVGHGSKEHRAQRNRNDV